MDLALNNLQWLICHKTKPNLTRTVPRRGKWLVTYMLTSDSYDLTCFCILDS